MTREELKFRANKIAETGLSGSVLELLIIGLAEEYAMEPPLQQANVRRSDREKVIDSMPKDWKERQRRIDNL